MQKGIKHFGIMVLVFSLFLGFSNYALAGEKGLIGYWKFDEGKGDVAKDSSGKENHGEIHKATWAEGKVGKALFFDGNALVNCGSDESLNLSGAFTVEAWLKHTETPKLWNRIIVKGAKNSPGQYKLTNIGGENSLYFILGTDQGGKSTDTEAVSFNLGEWNLWNATYDGTYLTLYKDGVEKTCKKIGAVSFTWAESSLIIGGSSPVYFKGYIDEVAIYNRALSAEEIRKDYQRAKAYKD